MYMFLYCACIQGVNKIPKKKDGDKQDKLIIDNFSAEGQTFTKLNFVSLLMLQKQQIESVIKNRKQFSALLQRNNLTTKKKEWNPLL